MARTGIKLGDPYATGGNDRSGVHLLAACERQQTQHGDHSGAHIHFPPGTRGRPEPQNAHIAVVRQVHPEFSAAGGLPCGRLRTSLEA